MSKKDYLKEGAGFVDITLHSPAKINGIDIATIRMREPTAADLENFAEMPGSDAKREITQFANLCEITPDEVRALTMRNYRRLQEAFMVFTS